MHHELDERLSAGNLIKSVVTRKASILKGRLSIRKNVPAIVYYSISRFPKTFTFIIYNDKPRAEGSQP